MLAISKIIFYIHLYMVVVHVNYPQPYAPSPICAPITLIKYCKEAPCPLLLIQY